MSFFSKLTGKFFKKKNALSDSSESQKHPGMVRTCIHLSCQIIYPSDMMEELGIAVACDTKAAVAYNSNEIKLFDMFDFNDNFIGSFYALKRNNMYYGHIIGQREIVACETDAFKFVKTDLLKIPFAQKGQNLYALICKYNAQKGTICPVSWGCLNNSVLVDKLHSFPENTSLRVAMDYCQIEYRKI